MSRSHRRSPGSTRAGGPRIRRKRGPTMPDPSLGLPARVLCPKCGVGRVMFTTDGMGASVETCSEPMCTFWIRTSTRRPAS